jgi:hypothetical protein
MGHTTLEEAARGEIPERFARVLCVSISPYGQDAIVLLGTNEPPRLHPLEVVCVLGPEGWSERSAGNGQGWHATRSDDVTVFGVLTSWDEAPEEAAEAVVAFAGREHTVPVTNGYYLFTAWDVPGTELSPWASAVRFLDARGVSL